MGNLSDKLGSLQFTPKSQAPLRAGTVIQAATNDVTAYEQAGWIKCDGSEYAEADYPDLFSVVGSKYNTGGETAGHFRVPNGPYRTVEMDLEITGGTATNQAKGISYSDALGIWYIQFVANGSMASSTSVTLNVTGLNFNGTQGLTGVSGGTGESGRYFTSGGTNTINVDFPVNGTNWWFNGPVRLNSKPLDTIVTLDSRFSTFDEALESIPMIKPYHDQSNISMSIADATATKTGAVRLSSDFAAGVSAWGLNKTCVARSSLRTSITGQTSGATVKVGFDQNDLSNNITWDGVNYRLTPNVEGYYNITGSIFISSDSANALRVPQVYVRKNGNSSNYIDNHRFDGSAHSSSSLGIQTGLPLSTLMYFNGTTDYLEIYAAGTTTSGTWSIVAGNASIDLTWVSMNKV